MMKTRIVYGSVMIALLVGLLWWDYHPVGLRGLPEGTLLACLLAVLLAGAYRELSRLQSATGTPLLGLTGLVLTLAVATLPVWGQLLPARFGSALTPLPALGLAVGLIFLVQMMRFRTDQAIRRVAATLLPVVYLGVLGACVLALRLRWGVHGLVLFLATVKATDMAAYFVGSRLGRHKLIPWLSPGKSWEGLGGGVLAAVAVAVGLREVLRACGISGIMGGVWQAGVFGLAMALVGQLGDLCESLLKREAGVKDSGQWIPSFGGLLDVLDSPLLAAPAAYVLLAVLR